MKGLEFDKLEQLLECFDTNQKCIEWLENRRWNDKIISPYDKNSTVYRLKDDKLFCTSTLRRFNVLTRTPLEKVKTNKWIIFIAAIWLLDKNNMLYSPVNLSHDLHVDQNSCWYVIKGLLTLHDSDDDFIFNEREKPYPILSTYDQEQLEPIEIENTNNDIIKDKLSDNLSLKEIQQLYMLAKFKKVFGDKYSYDKFKYTGIRDKVIITCPIHGDFEKRCRDLKVNNRKEGKNDRCPICAKLGFDNSIRSQEDINNYIIKKFREVHGDKYGYDKIKYINMTDKVTITCPIHGDFEQQPLYHIKGRGCAKCHQDQVARDRTVPYDQFINSAREIHGNKFEYDKNSYINLSSKIKIYCKKHKSWFNQKAAYHLKFKFGCPKCVSESRSLTKRSREEIIKKFREVHGVKYGYDRVSFKSLKDQVLIECPKHGYFIQTVSSHMKGCGCRKCNAESIRLPFDEFVKRARIIHGKKYIYHEKEYNGTAFETRITCPEHGDFFMKPRTHVFVGMGCKKCLEEDRFKTFVEKAQAVHGNKFTYHDEDYHAYYGITRITCPEHGDFWMTGFAHVNSKTGCIFCSSNHSNQEFMVYDLVRNYDPKTVVGNHTAINKEIDILSFDHNIGFEINGLHWHNELNKDKLFHKNKTMKCLNKNIRLIQFYDIEIDNKFGIVRSMINSLFGEFVEIINSDDCDIKVIDIKTAKKFHDLNSLNEPVNSTLALALTREDDILQLMNFSLVKFNYKTCWCLDCHSTKRSIKIQGGFDKLIKYFELNYLTTDKLITFIDMRIDTHLFYINKGFNKIEWRKPSYQIQVNKKLFSRQEFRKQSLVKNHGCDPAFNAHSFCLENQWYRIYDCGKMLMEKIYV